jgi:hypothetical protein
MAKDLRAALEIPMTPTQKATLEALRAVAAQKEMNRRLIEELRAEAQRRQGKPYQDLYDEIADLQRYL